MPSVLGCLGVEMIYQAPTEWVFVQGAGNIKHLSLHLELYKEFDAGGDGYGSRYAKNVSTWQPDPAKVRWNIDHRRKLHQGPQSPEPLPVVLNHQGHFELQDGHHRAARYVHDGAELVPLDIKLISPSWKRLVDDLDGIYPERPRHLYAEIEHPWFSTWPTSRGPERLSTILEAVGEHTSPADGSYLEIGSCTGRQAREFHRQGWRCFGVDHDPVVVRVAEYLDGIFGTRINYWNTSDYYPLLNEGPGWSVVACLSVFHRKHTAGEHEQVGRLFREFMDRAKVFVTDQERPGHLVNGKAAWQQAEYQKWLEDVAGDTHQVEHIGSTEGRPLYLCRRVK